MTEALRKLRARLEELLAVREVEEDIRLRMLCGALLLYSYLTFTSWYGRPGLSTLGTHTFNYVPHWAFENLRGLIFLDAFWTKTYFYVLFMSALLGLFLLFYRKGCFWPMVLLSFLFVNKLYYYLSDLRLMANFHHIHLLLTFIFLVSSSKLFFFRMGLLVCYQLSVLTKLTPSWLFGEYFNSVPDKLPLFPKASWAVTLAGQALILLEGVGPWLWFSRRKWLRQASFLLFFLFHAYSGVIVGHKYPSLMLPVLVPAFLRFHQPVQTGYRFLRRNLASWAFLGLAMVGGFWHLFIPGDVRLTAEGRYLGLFMFDANRAVQFKLDIVKGPKRIILQVERPWRTGAIMEDEGIERETRPRVTGAFYRNGKLEKTFDGATIFSDDYAIIFNPSLFTQAAYRTNGDPYLYYFYAKELCRTYGPDRLGIELYQQLDGHRERFKLLDLPDFCATNPVYRAFRHNEWILLPGSDSHPSYRWW